MESFKMKVRLVSALLLLVALVARSQQPSVKTSVPGGTAIQSGPPHDEPPKAQGNHFVVPPDDETAQALFGAHIQRAMTLLQTSSREKRFSVRILMYGQSIVGSDDFTRMMSDYLHQQFPNADIQFENRAIGGFEAPRLVRTAVHDLYPYYPDLVIFHVYGGQRTGEVERIISNIRRYTTADILLFNDHRQGTSEIQESSIGFWKQLTQKYDCELVDVSAAWPAYLHKHALEPAQLLRDGVHPNLDGYTLMTYLIARHLRYNPVFPNNWQQMVRTYDARRPLDEGANDEIQVNGDGWSLGKEGILGESPHGKLQLDFDGNRVDLIAAHADAGHKLGTAKLLLDGKPPSENPDVYAITRPSSGPGTWFPAIMRISHTQPLIVEDWTLRITRISKDANSVAFEVAGSKTGPDGSGTNEKTFISNSGRVKIEPRDWLLAQIMTIFKQQTPPPVGFEIHWSVKPMFEDEYRAPGTPDMSKVYETTLFQLISNMHHSLVIIPNGDGAVPIESLQVYRPPLR
jgi:hypothetical protein